MHFDSLLQLYGLIHLLLHLLLHLRVV
jgi:hypothetical protein